jgi:hypothetical protein
MSFTQGLTTQFKVNLLSGLENFASGTPYTYKIALYTSLANLDNTTLIYTSSNEIVGSGYTAGGKTLTVSQVPIGDTSQNDAYISFNNVTWNPASFTTRGALIYNGTTNASVCVLDFGSDKTAVGTFTITFPTATSTTAVIILN